ncbi:M15 family metallopeptidase [Gellertiella hungarica]|uniref:D-alanyl-D-alanine carboxypeptidase-like core domain-containing protein n=2 Tax=Gellertiella hungarica TaxID=1572859 RepID=A0A7W6J5U5_9HYPH|nr:hypothetical protein [Gellertiella hungarica]
MMDGMEALEGRFRERVEKVLGDLRDDGLEMRVTQGVRTPLEQARLWRQSRSREEIRAAMQHLKQAGAYYLAEVLDEAGRCHGPPVTKALPGLSWHQWGEAVDCVWIVDGVAEWSLARIVNRDNGYHAWARAAEAAGLVAGGLWPRFSDWPHVQMRREASPLIAGHSLKEIDEAMQARFA